jgi:hypothetical protein
MHETELHLSFGIIQTRGKLLHIAAKLYLGSFLLFPGVCNMSLDTLLGYWDNLVIVLLV